PRRGTVHQGAIGAPEAPQQPVRQESAGGAGALAVVLRDVVEADLVPMAAAVSVVGDGQELLAQLLDPIARHDGPPLRIGCCRLISSLNWSTRPHSHEEGQMFRGDVAGRPLCFFRFASVSATRDRGACEKAPPGMPASRARNGCSGAWPISACCHSLDRSLVRSCPRSTRSWKLRGGGAARARCGRACRG